MTASEKYAQLKPLAGDIMKNYQEVNRSLWNNKVDAHLRSDFYDQASFMAGRNSLNDIELCLLGDLNDKKVLHLQCHFGQDSLSLARMGAKVTGVDLSDKAISVAKNLNVELGLDAQFIACDLYDLPNYLEDQFDIVFSSYGTIGWLPDVYKWAKLIAQYLKPGGNFIFAEFHPVVWMFDDDFETLKYPYFNRGIIAENEEGTYADRSADLEQESLSWNHNLGEVLGALLQSRLQLRHFEEFDYSPYNCFKGTVENTPGKWRIQKMEDKLPLVYALKAEKS